MTRLGSIKGQLHTMQDLEDLTNILEQTAARTIAQLRKTILDSRPFFREVWRIYTILKQLSPPLPDVVHKHLIVAIGIDWGMPGNLLNRMVAEAERIRDEHGADLLVAGKMAHGRFKKDDGRTVHLFSIPRDSTLNDIQPIYKVVAGYAKVTIVYPKFESLSKQVISKISFSINDKEKLADDDNPIDDKEKKSSEIMASRFIIDPSPQEIANYLNEAIVGLTVYHYFAEAMLAYGAAQMISMRNGHDNAKQEADKLQTAYYRARRESIDSKLRELYGSRVAHKVVKL
jgi:F-type H+-transporting ATPase subunit gamma